MTVPVTRRGLLAGAALAGGGAIAGGLAEPAHASPGISAETWGVKADGITDDTAAAQAALDHAAAAGAGKGGAVEFPQGTIKLTSQLNVPDGVGIEGDGFATVFWAPTDFGAGKSAISIAPSGTPRFLRGFRVVGPGAGVSIGVQPANMDGLILAGATSYVDDVKVSGFRAGIVLAQDHQVLTNVRSNGNYYGIYWPNSNAKGNHYIKNFDFGTNALAAFGISNANSIQGSEIVDGHCGQTPFVFFKEDPTNAESFGLDILFLGYVTVRNCFAEGLGNGIAYVAGPRTNALYGQIDRNCDLQVSPSWDAAYQLRSIGQRPAYDVAALSGTVRANHSIADGTNSPMPGGVAAYSGFGTYGVTNLRVIGDPGPTVSPTTSQVDGDWECFGSYGQWVLAGSAIAVGQALEWSSDGSFPKVAIANGTGVPAGIAAAAAAATGQWIPIVLRGKATAKLTGSPRTGDVLVADPANPGNLKVGTAPVFGTCVLQPLGANTMLPR